MSELDEMKERLAEIDSIISHWAPDQEDEYYGQLVWEYCELEEKIAAAESNNHADD